MLLTRQQIGRGVVLIDRHVTYRAGGSAIEAGAASFRLAESDLAYERGQRGIPIDALGHGAAVNMIPTGSHHAAGGTVNKASPIVVLKNAPGRQRDSRDLAVS